MLMPSSSTAASGLKLAICCPRHLPCDHGARCSRQRRRSASAFRRSTTFSLWRSRRPSQQGSQAGAEFYALHRLTGFDYAVAGVAGILAALADIFLVWVPNHPGFLGATRLRGRLALERNQRAILSRSRQFDGCEIEIIDGLPDWSSRTSVETAGTGTGNPRRSPW